MSGSWARPIRIVIVHAHRLAAETLKLALEREPDIEVVGMVSSPHEAVAAASTGVADVVVADLGLADAHGPAVVAAIRSQVPDAAILTLASNGSDRLVQAAIRAGCNGVITLDRTVPEVVDAIRRTARGEVLFSADLLARLIPSLRERREIRVELSRRELEVLEMLRDGVSTRDIAGQLSLSHHTVRNHVQNLLGKLHAGNRLEAVAIAVRQGVIER